MQTGDETGSKIIIGALFNVWNCSFAMYIPVYPVEGQKWVSAAG